MPFPSCNLHNNREILNNKTMILSYRYNVVGLLINVLQYNCLGMYVGVGCFVSWTYFVSLPTVFLYEQMEWDFGK